MPICSIPSQTSADGNIYKAYGGLRLKKFVDAFGDKGQVFSICNSDFTNAMTQTGSDLVQAMTGNADCVPYALTDAAPNTPGLQPTVRLSTALRATCRAWVLVLRVATRKRPCPSARIARGTCSTGQSPTRLRERRLTALLVLLL